MKKIFYSIIWIAAILVISSCDNSSQNTESPNLLTGNTETYTLYQASDYNIEGEVTFSELKTGFTQININVTPTQKGLLHPVHIHISSIEMNGKIAVVLNPIDGETGISITELIELEDASTLLYKDLVAMDASLKIHLSSTGPDYKTILVGGNIGSAKSKENPFSRREITICQ